MIREFSDWLSMTQLSVAFQSASWFVPLVQTVHIIAIAVLLSSVYFISFKLLGFIRGSQSLAAASAASNRRDAALDLDVFRHCCPAGLAMFSSKAVTYADNLPFRIKLACLMLAG